MSSHREAPEISKDPVADSTDLYAFVSPDKPEHRHAHRQLHPAAGTGRRPELLRVRRRRPVRDPHRQQRRRPGRHHLPSSGFTTDCADPDTFLYNTGPITSLTSPNWNRRQFYTVTDRRPAGRSAPSATGLACPPCNIGPLSTPNYPPWPTRPCTTCRRRRSRSSPASAPKASTSTSARSSTWATCGRSRTCTLFGSHRAQQPPRASTRTKGLNVHSIAIQVPISRGSTRDRVPPRPSACGPRPAASGQGAADADSGAELGQRAVPGVAAGQPAVQRGPRSRWARRTSGTAAAVRRQAVRQLRHPPGARGAAAGALPGRVPEPGRLVASEKPRADLVAILLTGIPTGIIPGFQNYTGPVLADMLRLNMAIPPTPSQAEHPRAARRRRGRLPERPPGVRRRRDDRAARDRRGDLPAGRPDVHARRRRGASSPTG